MIHFLLPARKLSEMTFLIGVAFCWFSCASDAHERQYDTWVSKSPSASREANGKPETVWDFR